MRARKEWEKARESGGKRGQEKMREHKEKKERKDGKEKDN